MGASPDNSLNDPNGENYAAISPNNNYQWNDLINSGSASQGDYWLPGMMIEYNANPDQQITATTYIDVGEATFPPVIQQPPAAKIAPGVQTIDNASQSLSVIDDAIGKVTDVRTYLGAMQNSLQAVIDHLTSSGTNAQQANGRLIDTDYAETTTQLSRNQIISQAATAMLAQANQVSQLVLQLLKP